MSAKEVASLLKSLEKSKGDSEQELNILGEMKATNWKTLSLSILKSSSCGKKVNAYTKHPDKRISSLANELVEAWKKTASSSSSGKEVASAVSRGSGSSGSVGGGEISSGSSSAAASGGGVVSSEHPRATLLAGLERISSQALPSLPGALSYPFTTAAKCLPGRYRELKPRTSSSSAASARGGPVVYWMSRDQRVC